MCSKKLTSSSRVGSSAGFIESRIGKWKWSSPGGGASTTKHTSTGLSGIPGSGRRPSAMGVGCLSMSFQGCILGFYPDRLGAMAPPPKRESE